MNGSIGDILPFALGIAISPIPIIAVILLLLSPRARVSSLGFTLGWVLGIVIAVTLFAVVSSPISGSDAPGVFRGILQLVLGLLAIAIAAMQWRKRPREGVEPAMPKWMSALDSASFPFTLGIGFVLAAVNPKNLVMAANAGTTISAAALDVGSVVIVILVYVLVAASTVLVPVIGVLLAADKLRDSLDRMRVWLTAENSVIMAVLMLVLGVTSIGKGLASF